MNLPDSMNIQLVLGTLTFISASLFFSVLIMWLSTGLSPARRRLHELGEEEHKPGEVYDEKGFTVKWLEPVAHLVTPQEGWKRSHMKSRLITAGYRSKKSQHLFLFSKILLAFLPTLLVGFPLVLLGYFGSDPETAIIFLVTLAIAGFFFPDAYLAHRKENRQRRMEEGFPDALDLLVVCVEAGLSLDAAIQRVAQELIFSHPELGEELSLVSLELRAGKSRAEALRSLADRTGLHDIKSLTSILIQAEHFGTSIASALSEHSQEMRSIRIQRAREKAAKLPVKMTFPIIFFIFPAIFLVVLGPSVIRIFTNLLN